MLTRYEAQNFKSFAQTQSIPIRPITLIFGPNSSGMSTPEQKYITWPE